MSFYHNIDNCQDNFQELSQVLVGFIITLGEPWKAKEQLKNCIEKRITSTNSHHNRNWDNSHIIALNHLIQLYDAISNYHNYINNITYEYGSFRVSYNGGYPDTITYRTTDRSRINLNKKYIKYKNKYIKLKNKTLE